MKPKAPCVDLKTDAMKDERFQALGDFAGYNRFEAFGRMYALWSWCVDRGLKDAPDDCKGYAVSEAIVVRFLGPRGVSAVLGDGCDELALGVRLETGRIYLRGTSEYVGARRRHRDTATAGGEARARGVRDPSGRFVSETTNVQPAASRTPPPSSFLLPSSSSGLEDSDLGVQSLSSSSSEGAAPAADTPTQFDSNSWNPEPSDANLHAALEAKTRSVHVDHALSKFRAHAHAKGWSGIQCELQWPIWLLNEFPTAAPIREALAKVDREKNRRAALDRERAEFTEHAKLVEESREDARRVLEEWLADPRREPKEATG